MNQASQVNEAAASHPAAAQSAAEHTVPNLEEPVVGAETGDQTAILCQTCSSAAPKGRSKRRRTFFKARGKRKGEPECERCGNLIATEGTSGTSAPPVPTANGVSDGAETVPGLRDSVPAVSLRSGSRLVFEEARVRKASIDELLDMIVQLEGLMDEGTSRALDG